MKPPDPYLSQELLLAYFGIAILLSIIRRIRYTTGTQTRYIDTQPDTQRDGVRKRVGRFYYLASVMMITRLACIINITRMALIEAGTSIIKKTCSVFYDGVVDPVGTWSAN